MVLTVYAMLSIKIQRAMILFIQKNINVKRSNPSYSYMKKKKHENKSRNLHSYNTNVKCFSTIQNFKPIWKPNCSL